MKLYVGNLPWKVKDEDLEKLFQTVGQVISAHVITDRDHPGRSKGFGFVEMDAEAGQEAIERMNGHEIDGRPLRVNEAQERSQSGDRGDRGRGGGGGRGGYGGGGGGGGGGNY